MDWRADPCWDIEDTKGFEEHRSELLEWSKECQKYWVEQDALRHEPAWNIERSVNLMNNLGEYSTELNIQIAQAHALIAIATILKDQSYKENE